MQEQIVIGEVLKPQGIRGEVKVKPLVDDPADLKKVRKVFIGGAEYKVLSARTDAQAAYFALSGVADRNAAELLRGRQVLADRADLPALDEGRSVFGCFFRAVKKRTAQGRSALLRCRGHFQDARFSGG